MQFCAAGGAAVGAVEPQHSEERPQGAAPRDQPEHTGQGVSPLPGSYASHLEVPRLALKHRETAEPLS